MPNTLYTPRPMTDWSSEISGGPAVPAAASANSSTTTTTTTSSSSSSSSGGHAAQAPATVTQTTTQNPAAQNPAYQSPAAQSPAYQSPAVQNPAVQNPAAQSPAYQGSAYPAPSAPPPASYPQESQTLPARNEFEGSIGTLDLQTHQPIEVVEAPTSMNEAFLGSLKSMLLRNRGNFVTATFLIGTQGTTAWEGILHDVGNDYIIIFQPGRERYIACDIYSLKYIEFYDTRRRDMCETMLRQNGMRNTF